MPHANAWSPAKRARECELDMKLNVAVAAVVLANILSAGSAGAQVVNLGNSGPSGAAIQWQGPQTNARAGASLLRADMSGASCHSDMNARPDTRPDALVIVCGSHSHWPYIG